MDQKKDALEIIASSVDEAIREGLRQLNLPREKVEVEILDGDEEGFMGVEKHQAKVRFVIKQETESTEENNDRDEAQLKGKTISASSNENEPMDKLESAQKEVENVIKDLLGFMKISADIEIRLIEPEDEHDRLMILVEIKGKNLSILIGRRSETLNALQYITSLILCQRLGHWMPVMLDVQGYRFRRERQLQRLARRLADQVVQTGRKQVLESMSANERRIIHLELRYHPFVTTKSIGEEPNRRVTISLKPKNKD